MVKLSSYELGDVSRLEARRMGNISRLGNSVDERMNHWRCVPENNQVFLNKGARAVKSLALGECNLSNKVKKFSTGINIANKVPRHEITLTRLHDAISN